MRPLERIPIFLNKVNWYKLIHEIWGNLDEDATLDVYSSIKNNIKDIEEFWLDNPDLRISQVLVNLGIIPNSYGRWYYLEENEILEKLKIPHRDFILWGTRGINGDGPVEYLLLKDLTTSHIEAIIKTQKRLSDKMIDIFKEELKFRNNV